MPKIIVVLAVFHPDENALTAQLVSLKNQDHSDFEILAVIADKDSADLVKTCAKNLGLRLTTVERSTPLSAVAAFEFGLSEAMRRWPHVQHFALCDQDDVWHAARLSLCLQTMSKTQAGLVHSDARVIDEAGKLLSGSLHRLEHRLRTPSLRALLRRNTVTGMTVLVSRTVLEAALPFPAQEGTHFYHDLWLALVAKASSTITFIDQPLVDYRQHGRNAVGAVVSHQHRKKPFNRWLRDAAGAYALSRYFAQTLATRLPDAPLSQLSPYLSPSDTGIPHLIDACALILQGKVSHARQAISHALVALASLVWIARFALTNGLRTGRTTLEAKLFGLSPGMPPAKAPTPSNANHPTPIRAPATPWWTYFDPRTQPRWTVELGAYPTRVNLLIPSLNPAEMFAGIATAADLGLGLLKRGIDVRFIATDLPIASHSETRSFLLGRANGKLKPEQIEIVCGVTATQIEFSNADQFLATAWWTAHVAHKLLTSHAFSTTRFQYLIQDYEPGFYPWGDEYAGALQSYDFDFDPIFNTSLLADWFRAEGYDWATGRPLTFHPSIDVAFYANLKRPETKGPKHLVIYGRPEVSRNMFHTAVQALGHFIDANDLTTREITCTSVGMSHQDILMPNAVTLTSRGKLPWSEYPDFLASVDFGVALMLSPHPSHLPIEMAAAGARVITNAFGPKDLSTLTPALQSAAPNVDALAEELTQAWARGAPDETERNFPLAPLGVPFDDMVDALALKISPASTLKSAA